MIKKLLIGVAVVLGAAVVLSQILIGVVLAVGVWIYLAAMIRKRKNNIFNDQMESQVVERYLKRLKVLLIAAGILFFIGIVSTILHNVLSGLSKIEEPVSFIIAFVTFLLFVITTAGGLFIFLKERQLV